ncbi:LOW QUALITY PROTEIN: tumor necrosis factor ligand superfamily member 18 [Mastomys coucha]|uniref:LOW QUALITY PROTEIN: tumor necrosis factor ligand superfamily member 18 n=1 Tax=Mastomys coucha TaxID=35658 RepID=UPI001261A59D|nr:LOW QUALITY PROTEIN: tumor necrosis factor ligand superfamily member 18 [Mastomys coucha]
MTLHRSSITCGYLLSTVLIPPRMSSSLMEEMPLSESNPRGAERGRKPWLLCIVALLLMLFCTLGTLIFTSLKPTAKQPCMVKFELLSSKWQMTSPEPHCVNMTSNGMVKILRKGVYLIYGQVTPVDKKYIKDYAPFVVQIFKNNDVLQTLTNDFQLLPIGGIYELHAGDKIHLMFNSKDHIQKNNTYWGIILMPDLSFTF